MHKLDMSSKPKLLRGDDERLNYSKNIRATVTASMPNPLTPLLAPAPVKTGAAGNVGTVALAESPGTEEAEPVALLVPYEALLKPAG